MQSLREGFGRVVGRIIVSKETEDFGDDLNSMLENLVTQNITGFVSTSLGSHEPSQENIGKKERDLSH